MPSAPLDSPRRVVSSNDSSIPSGYTEPGVQTTKETIEPSKVFEGNVRRTYISNGKFPASNDGPLDITPNPGAGIVHPGGTSVYFLDFAPGFVTPMHRTVSADFMVLQKGTPTLITPKGPFNIVDDKGTYEETVETECFEGEVVIQRGQMHAWANRTDSWVRFLCVIVEASPQVLDAGAEVTPKTPGEVWL